LRRSRAPALSGGITFERFGGDFNDRLTGNFYRNADFERAVEAISIKAKELTKRGIATC
jgi:hypothetical protein